MVDVANSGVLHGIAKRSGSVDSDDCELVAVVPGPAPSRSAVLVDERTGSDEECELVSITPVALGPGLHLARSLGRRRSRSARSCVAGAATGYARPPVPPPEASLSTGVWRELGVPAPKAHYYVQPWSSAARRVCCFGCEQPVLDGMLCLGFQRPWLSKPSWVHAVPRCLRVAELPPLPSSRVLFSPAVRWRERHETLCALRASMPTATEAALRRLAAWRHLPAAEQNWASVASTSRDSASIGSPGRAFDGDSLGSDARAALRTLTDAAVVAAGGVSRDRSRVSSPVSLPKRPSDNVEALISLLAPARLLVSGEARDEYCSVCYERLSRGGRPVRCLPCAHSFHDDCIIPWLLKNPVCPLDRRALCEMLVAGPKSDIDDFGMPEEG